MNQGEIIHTRLLNFTDELSYLEFFKTSVSVKNWNQCGYVTVCVKIICVCMSVCQPVCVGVLSVGVSVRLCVCACIFEKEMVKHADSEAMGG